MVTEQERRLKIAHDAELAYMETLKNAANIEEAKKLIEKAGIDLTDEDEILKKIAGGIKDYIPPL